MIYINYRKIKLGHKQWSLQLAAVSSRIAIIRSTKKLQFCENNSRFFRAYYLEQEFEFLMKRIITLAKKHPKMTVCFINEGERLVQRLFNKLKKRGAHVRPLRWTTENKSKNKMKKLKITSFEVFGSRHRIKFVQYTNPWQIRTLEINSYPKVHKHFMFSELVCAVKMIKLFQKVYAASYFGWLKKGKATWEEKLSEFNNLALARTLHIQMWKKEKSKFMKDNLKKPSFRYHSQKWGTGINYTDGNSIYMNTMGTLKRKIIKYEKIFLYNRFGVFWPKKPDNIHFINRGKNTQGLVLTSWKDNKKVTYFSKHRIRNFINTFKKRFIDSMNFGVKSKGAIKKFHKNIGRKTYGLLHRKCPLDGVQVIAKNKNKISNLQKSNPYQYPLYSDTDSLGLKGNLPYKYKNSKIAGLYKNLNKLSNLTIFNRLQVYITQFGKYFYKKGK